MRSILRELVTIMCVSVFLALLYNAFSPKGIPLIRAEMKKVAVSDSELFVLDPQVVSDTTLVEEDQSENSSKSKSMEKSTPQLDSSVSSAKRVEQALLQKDKTYNIISLTQFTRILSAGNAVVFDARNPEEFRQGRVHGARNIFGLEAEDHFEELVQIPRDTLIVIYCNNPECHLGSMLADFMHLLGFTKLYLYDGGWDGWIEAKMPVDTSMIHN